MIRIQYGEAEQTDFPTVIAFDPGGTTGWCVMTVHYEALLSDDYPILDNIIHHSQGELLGDEIGQLDEIASLFDVWDSAAIVFEDFQLRTLAAELSPVRIKAVAEYIAATMFLPARTVFDQMPSLAMTTATDERLKSWGLYHKGEEHARDAERHAITFLRRAKTNRKLRTAAWPKLYPKAV